MKVNSFAVLLFLIASSAFAQITETDYKRAESFLQFNIDKKLYYKSVEPNWSENTDWFSYMATTPKGKEFFKVNTAKKQKSACFDVQKLTTAINNFTKKTYETTSLPFSNVTVVDEFSVKFNIDSTEFVFNSKQNLLTRKPIEKVLNSKELKTPDGKNIVYIENGNIFLRNIATCAKTQISFDGTPENGYGHNLDWYATTNDSKGEKNDYSIEVYFSADSSKIIIPRFNREKTRRLQLYKSSVEGSYQSEIISYERSLAGDTNLTTVCYYIYDIAANKLIKTELEEAPAFLGTYVYTPAKSKKSYRIVYSRGYKKRDLIEIDNQIGKTKLLLSEENKKTYVDLYTEQFEANTETNEFIWASEQSGWNQLYLYDLQTG
ncbi:MAG TPA: hypothetical protein DCQ31_08010, partial [Bacteroidales bacterium]|nr:hypothetical protein [Bacteroidales bacterium]